MVQLHDREKRRKREDLCYTGQLDLYLACDLDFLAALHIHASIKNSLQA
jgi:hypothetical protein